MKVHLWHIGDTEKAHHYWRTPASRSRVQGQDDVWVPKSLVEHRSKDGDEHEVTLPDWFCEKEKL